MKNNYLDKITNRALLLEKDRDMAKAIELSLSQGDIACDVVEFTAECVNLASSSRYDIIIVDLDNIDIEGTEAVSEIKKVNHGMPIMAISNDKSIERLTLTLKVGADDYVIKPFRKEEIIARIRAIIRRATGYTQAIIKIGDMEIDTERHMTKISGKSVNLTAKEQSMLELLAIRKGRPVSKDAFLNYIYNGMDEPELKIIDVFVCRMRKKLSRFSNGKDYIKTAWGRGYTIA